MSTPVSPIPFLLGGGYAMLANAVPTWTTPAGALGSSDEGTSFNTTLVATHPVSVTYAIQSGSLPPGLSLNSATGVVSGTLGQVLQTTTFTFAARAISAGGAGVNRTFNLTTRNVYADPDVIAHFRFNNTLNDETGQWSLAQVGIQAPSYITGLQGSALRNNAGGSYFDLPSDAWPTGDYTLEFFSSALSGSSSNFLRVMRGGGLILRRDLTSGGLVENSYSSGSATVFSCPSSWHHVAIQKQGTERSLFVDGLPASVAAQDVGTMSGAVGLLKRLSGTGLDGSGGFLDEFRLSRVARYSRNFAPPSAPLPLPANDPHGGVSLHLRLAGATPFQNLTGSGTVTNNGVALATEGPFGVGQAATFTNSGAATNLSIPFATAFPSATSNFVIEFWINHNGGALRQLIDMRDEGNLRGFGVALAATTSNLTIQSYAGPDELRAATGSSITDPISGGIGTSGVWQHIALARSMNHLAVFMNGVLRSTLAFGGLRFATSRPLLIGANAAGGARFNGAIYDFRITNGSNIPVRYPAPPPSAAFPA